MNRPEFDAHHIARLCTKSALAVDDRAAKLRAASSSASVCAHVRTHHERDVGVAEPRGDESDGRSLQVHEGGAGVPGVVQTYLGHVETPDGGACHIVDIVEG